MRRTHHFAHWVINETTEAVVYLKVGDRTTGDPLHVLLT